MIEKLDISFPFCIFQNLKLGQAALEKIPTTDPKVDPSAAFLLDLDIFSNPRINRNELLRILCFVSLEFYFYV